SATHGAAVARHFRQKCDPADAWLPCKPARYMTVNFRSMCVLRDPLTPFAVRAVENIDIGVSANARDHPSAGILPEREGVASIFLGRMAGHGSQPVAIAGKCREVIVVEEVDGRIDDRFLAVVTFDEIEEYLHFTAHG